MPDVTELATVFAIECRPGLYEPRSQATLTATAPKLWVHRCDAEKQLRKVQQIHRSARIREFALLPVPGGGE